MCSLSMPIKMENFQGDLTDILRAGAAGSSTVSSIASTSLIPAEEEETRGGGDDRFGDPFSSYIRDPLLHELTTSSSSAFVASSTTSEMNVEASTHRHAMAFGQLRHGEVAKRPLDSSSSNMFSRMIQISPGGGDVAAGIGGGGGGVMVGSNDVMNAGVALQISSPRNPGIKRRKSLKAKKVVCIPAPAAVNSRLTGEVVPSDLWAWRKYGQKPIKGSPYPRGYYRCSSSKGCSARKQVERSRTNPNMLVITYTSEHNHPWPTQRNALAGSTRLQPSKAAGNSKTSPNPTSHQHQKPSSPQKEEHSATIATSSSVKEEFEVDELDQGFDYRPLMENENYNNHGDDFFADLGEIGGADPLNLLFSNCFTEDEKQKGIFDWSENQNLTPNNDSSSFGHEAKRP